MPDRRSSVSQKAHRYGRSIDQADLLLLKEGHEISESGVVHSVVTVNNTSADFDFRRAFGNYFTMN
jgi:hypothetical protein